MAGNVNVLVIGAGVGGMATARELLARGIPGRRIAIVGDGLGGRLRTVTTAAGDRLEAGAGRYSRVLHPRLDDLVRSQGLAVDPFAFDVSHCRTSTPTQALRGTDLTTLPTGGSFFQALAHRIGVAAADTFVTATGYEALRDKDFPVAGGVAVAGTHPECAAAPGRHRWVRPHAGFGGLIDRLAADLRGRGVRIRTDARVDAVRRSGDGLTVDLRREDWRSPHRISTRTAVLAMAPTDVDTIGLPADADLSWRPATRRIGLYKCFLVYERAWWDMLGLRHRCLITGDRMQKLYFDSARRSIFFYCDGDNSHHWSRLHGSALEQEVFRSVEAAAGPHLATDLRRPTEVHSQHWRSGTEYLTQSDARPLTGVVELTENLLLTSDSLTDNPGWIEGALAAAESAAALAVRNLHRPVARSAVAA